MKENNIIQERSYAFALKDVKKTPELLRDIEELLRIIGSIQKTMREKAGFVIRNC